MATIARVVQSSGTTGATDAQDHRWAPHTLDIAPGTPRTVADLKGGDHICCLYETEEEHRAVLTPYLRQGLERGEKVVYIVDAHTAETVLSYLRDDGLDPEPFVARGQLAILSGDETYLRGGGFDPARMIALLWSELERALAEGFAALRVTGEMTWALRGRAGSERLIEYEVLLDEFFSGSRCLAICQYDRRRFEAAVLLDVLRAHPHVAIGTEVYANPHFVPPPDFYGADRPAADLRRWIQGLTERGHFEDKLRHITRLNALRSQIDGAIVRIREQDELFRAICQLAVEFGQFRMAWVGLTDEVDGRVRPIAHAGDEDGYLDQVSITTGDLPMGKGPTGEALKCGYRSSAAVPFRRKGKPVGTLNLHASEPGFFAEDERELLQEIGEDISVALDAMESETSRREAEEAYHMLQAQLRQAHKAESLGRMAGAIAHHYNNLLGAVLLHLELALDALPSDSSVRENLAEAMEASRRAAEIGHLMLEYLGQDGGRRVPVDLCEVCLEALPLLRSSLPKNIRLKTEFPAQGVIVQANAEQMKQVLTNLVVNAGEAIGEREGSITATINVIQAADIQAARFFPADWEPKVGTYACLSVADTGCGMTPEVVDKVFDPFFSTKFTGRGLGLPVVMGIVGAHEGASMVESRRDHGTTFRAFLPVIAEQVLPPWKAEPVEFKKR